MSNLDHLGPFDVFELGRYRLREGAEASFVTYFESYFPEAFQALSALVHGHFGERGEPDRFTWLRGYPSMAARLRAKTAFYDGPLWREHCDTMNERLLDWADVRLLRPVSPATRPPVLPAVDPLAEPGGAQGLAVLQLFAVCPERLDALAERLASDLADQRRAGARDAGLLVTLDAPNDFPRHPVRDDGPWLVALGLVEDAATLAEVLHLSSASQAAIDREGWLRAAPELVALQPGRRSRLRWR